jgi:parallel beta-helix repeat protein
MGYGKLWRALALSALFVIGIGLGAWLPFDTPASSSSIDPFSDTTPTPTPEQDNQTRYFPTTLHLEADSSGDYATLEEAVQYASPGATIILGSGTYRLTKPLEIRQSLRLVGESADQIEIVSTAKDYVIRIDGAGPFVAENITFRHESEAAADVVIVRGGEATFTRCRFTGAVYVEGEGKKGVGLRIQGNTTGIVQDCVATENATMGILVEEQARPTLARNVCANNTLVGIAYSNGAGGTARQNTCSGNLMGIYADNRAQPTLEANVCIDNEKSGIAYRGNTGGEARQNECSRNGQEGIYIGEQARPTLERNVCTNNAEAGITYWDNASGVARQNECRENRRGIYVDELASPTLEENVCTDNENSGITYAGNAAGVASYNECSRNGLTGIYVDEQARPTLENNICRDNGSVGIDYRGNAGGMARQNECQGSEIGIRIADTATPTLTDNDCP